MQRRLICESRRIARSASDLAQHIERFTSALIQVEPPPDEILYECRMILHLTGALSETMRRLADRMSRLEPSKTQAIQ